MRNREQGSALVVVLLVVLALMGMGLMALRQTRTEMTSSGNIRTGRQACETAYAGLNRASNFAQAAPEFFHREAVRNALVTLEDGSEKMEVPWYLFGEELDEPGMFEIVNPLNGDDDVTTRDVDRLGKLEFRARMSAPRLALGPAGFQVAGSSGNRMVFYTYVFDVNGWVNREPGTAEIAPYSGGARASIRADVRLGPIAINQ